MLENREVELAAGKAFIVPPIDLTFHQYLSLTNEPLLVHTGSIQQGEALIPQLKDVLDGRTLKYIFVSHFESDECGGMNKSS